MKAVWLSAVSVAEFKAAPGLAELLAEYEAEARSPELPPAQPQWAHYEALAEAGVLTAILARNEDEAVGFIVLLRAQVPHYAEPMFVVESLFVAKAHRRTGAGRKLLKMAETHAAEHGGCLHVTAPAGSTLEAILPRMGYRHSNTVFVKGVKC